MLPFPVIPPYLEPMYLGVKIPIWTNRIWACLREVAGWLALSINKDIIRYMGPFGSIWAHMDPYGPVWAYMVPYGPVWACWAL